MNIAINGFGRIGKQVLKRILQEENLTIVAINDLAPSSTQAHLLKYDSVHGIFNGNVSSTNDQLIINTQNIPYTQIDSPEKLPWKKYNVDIVIDCTGKIKTLEQANLHIQAGAKKVILSAPASDQNIPTVVLGVNDHIVNDSDIVYSNASCTTNSAAPMIAILDELCEIESAYITTVHSYTGDQRLHDSPHQDLRRARAAAMSIIPTTTGAAKAITKIFPHLTDKIGGCGIRVPVPDGSLTDISCVVKRPESIEKINKTFENASNNQLKGILQYTEDPIVGVDIIGNTHSCIYDAQLTSVIGNMVKIVGWYDNEIGYSNRLVDLVLLLNKVA